MKQIGLLYGQKLMLDTDDKEIATLAEEFLTNLTKQSQELSDLKMKLEMDKLLK